MLGASSSAGAMTGNELREYCATRWDLCHGFIVGAAGMFWYQMEIIKPICFGDNASWEQVHDVVVNYLEEHPEARREDALILITWAIREAFDCPEAQGQSMGNEENIDDGRHDGAVGASPSGP
jgi:Rap1a immunity proteins